MATEDDQKRQAEVLAEIEQLGIRYPIEPAPPPKDEAEAIEQERRAIEIRDAHVLNRELGEPPAPPELTVIDGGKAKDEP